MRHINTTGDIINNIHNVLLSTPPKELEVVKDGDYARTITRFSKLTDKFGLENIEKFAEEKNAIAKEARARFVKESDGLSDEEKKALGEKLDAELSPKVEALAEKYEINSLNKKEYAIELSDEQWKLLNEVFPVIGKTRFNAVKPFADALEAIEAAKEA